MLKNILEYDSKEFVFSMNGNRKTNDSLHHNSLVSTYKKNRRIDVDNERIHFRINKAKSLYSQYVPIYSVFSPVKPPGILTRCEMKASISSSRTRLTISCWLSGMLIMLRAKRKVSMLFKYPGKWRNPSFLNWNSMEHTIVTSLSLKISAKEKKACQIRSWTLLSPVGRFAREFVVRNLRRTF